MLKTILNFFSLEEEKEQIEVNMSNQETKHEWELVAKTYAPPVTLENMENIAPDVLQKVIFGVTTYVWQCKLTGDVRKEEILGTDENQLFDILGRVDKFGMQYVKENGKVYGIAEWVPPMDEKK